MSESNLVFEDWGLIDYKQALDQQIRYVEEISEGKRADTIVFCSHPPIVTLGRVTKPGDITTWSGETLEVSRGGRATYHGPNQLVIYPILNLSQPRGNRPAKDIGGLLRDFENSIVKVLFDLGIKNATGKTYRNKDSKQSSAEQSTISENEIIKENEKITENEKIKNQESLEDTGVWVGSQKIASLGLAIRKWTSFHGAALNVEFDPQAFKGMKPCGYEPSVMTSVEEVIGAKPDWEFIKLRLKVELTSNFGQS